MVALICFPAVARHTIERIQLLPRPRLEVFAFFSSAHNLERITAPFVGFQILTPAPIEMAPGTLIDYKLRLWGLPVKWRTRIEEFKPEERFVDVQVRGPYRLWRHEHEFREVDGGTEVRDKVEYELPMGVFGNTAGALFVHRSVRKIFDYREKAMTDIFA